MKTARLPIKENVKLNCTSTLTIVNVFEILLRFHEFSSWAPLLEATIPGRKINKTQETRDESS